jgi:hypothetical protein
MGRSAVDSSIRDWHLHSRHEAEEAKAGWPPRAAAKCHTRAAALCNRGVLTVTLELPNRSLTWPLQPTVPLVCPCVDSDILVPRASLAALRAPLQLGENGIKGTDQKAAVVNVRGSLLRDAAELPIQCGRRESKQPRIPIRD